MYKIDMCVSICIYIYMYKWQKNIILTSQTCWSNMQNMVNQDTREAHHWHHPERYGIECNSHRHLVWAPEFNAFTDLWRSNRIKQQKSWSKAKTKSKYKGLSAIRVLKNSLVSHHSPLFVGTLMVAYNSFSDTHVSYWCLSSCLLWVPVNILKTWIWLRN